MQHEELKQNHYQHLSALQVRYKMLEKYIDQAYEDKLSGGISEGLWRTKNSKWITEQDKIRQEMGSIGDDKQEIVERGVKLIELAQRFETIYENATQSEKRELVEFVSSNHVLKNGSIGFTYEKPFDLLVEGSSKSKWWTLQGSNLLPDD